MNRVSLQEEPVREFTLEGFPEIEERDARVHENSRGSQMASLDEGLAFGMLLRSSKPILLRDDDKEQGTVKPLAFCPELSYNGEYHIGPLENVHLLDIDIVYLVWIGEAVKEKTEEMRVSEKE